eukprot:SAG11_NODE_16863_length_535_cov_0.715596_1_plen_50_part_01
MGLTLASRTLASLGILMFPRPDHHCAVEKVASAHRCPLQNLAHLASSKLS